MNETEKKVTESLQEHLKVFLGVEVLVRLEDTLSQDLDLDELDLVELCLFVEEEFELNIPVADWDAAQTVQDVANLVQRHQ